MSPNRTSAETASAPAPTTLTGPGALRTALFDPAGWATVV